VTSTAMGDDWQVKVMAMRYAGTCACGTTIAVGTGPAWRTAPDMAVPASAGQPGVVGVSVMARLSAGTTHRYLILLPYWPRGRAVPPPARGAQCGT